MKPMLRGFWQLVWVELKIFLREPLGVVSSIGLPIVIFLVLGRSFAGKADRSAELSSFARTGLPVLAALLIGLGAALSLVAIITIYREGGILKRLRATPLRPLTILGAHVALKLGLTATTLALLVLAGKRFYPLALEASLASFTVALLVATLSMLSLGFVIASAVRTARFAQPVASAVLYPLIAISGLAGPIEALPAPWATVARLSPVTWAVSLLSGIWNGEPWSAHWLDVAVLVGVFAVCSAISSRIFRWE